MSDSDDPIRICGIKRRDMQDGRLLPTISRMAASNKPHPDGGGSLVVERQAQRVKPPAMYQVVLLNDNFTPMEFVVVVIQQFFNKDRETATQIMLKVHQDGRGVCGVYTRDIAATKVEQVIGAARQAGHPLQCVMEAI
jgi:ATP-dependent Clp protease adaptor protein ClpS